MTPGDLMDRTADRTTAPTDSGARPTAAPSAHRGLAAAAGAIGAAFLASLCCVGPLAFVAFGIWTLRGDRLTEEDRERAARPARHTVLAVGTVFFLA